MDYIKHYILLIEKSRNRIKKNCYYEKHHIIPKSIFGNIKANKILNYCNIIFKWGKENTVYLLAEEHFVAHLLLVRIFKNINTDAYERMLFAANFLNNRNKIHNKKYGLLKKEFSKMMSNKLKGKPGRAKGYKWTKERKKIGNIYLKNKTYEEIHGFEKAQELKKSRAKVRKGKKLEEICGAEKAKIMKEKLSKIKKNKKWRTKISEAKKGQTIKESTKNKISKFMSNDKLNPNVDQQKYIFEHMQTKKRIVERKIDMKKKYKCNTIYKVINGTRKQSKGWKFIKKYEGELEK